MNRKGFIFTLDATLSLIPIFILLVSASSLAPSTSFGTVRHLRMTQFAQDSMVVLSDNLGNTSSPMESYLNSSSTTSIDNFLRNTSAQWNYMLMMNDTSGWGYVTGKADSSYTQSTVNASLQNSPNTVAITAFATNTSSVENNIFLFKMYVWEG